MTSGDVVFEVNNLRIRDEDVERQAPGGGTVDHRTEFGGGTVVSPAGAGVEFQPSTLVVRQQPLPYPSEGFPESLFDTTKRYKLTITEV